MHHSSVSWDQLFCTFSSKSLYALNKNIWSKCKFSGMRLLAWKLTKFFKCFFKRQISFPSSFCIILQCHDTQLLWNHKVRVYSNFVSLFMVMKDNFSVFVLAQIWYTLDENSPSKWNLRIWEILIRALKNLKHLHFNWLPLTEVFNVWAKKSTGEIYLMALNIDAKFERGPTFSFTNDMRNLENFHLRTWKSPNWDFMGFFYLK